MAETAQQRAARQERERKLAAEKTKQAEAEAAARRAEADARARAAEAEARAAESRIKAEAEARRIEAETRAAELAAKQETERRQAADKQAEIERQNDPLQKAWKLGVSVLAPVAGYVLGKKLAGAIEARHITAVKAANTELKAIAKPIGADMAKAQRGTGPAARGAVDRLVGAVRAADAQKLQRTKGPLGLASAGLLLAEGAYARFVLAKDAEHPIAKDGLNAVGTASLFAATAQIGQRLLANATPSNLISTPAAAKIEAARAMVERMGHPVAAPATIADKVKTFAQAAPRSKAAGVATLITAAGAGLYALLPDKAKATPAAGPADAMAPGPEMPRAVDIARAAAGSTLAGMETRDTLGAASPLPNNGDGFTEGYTRIQNGQAVRVQGYRTPK